MNDLPVKRLARAGSATLSFLLQRISVRSWGRRLTPSRIVVLLLGLVCCLPMPVRGDMWTNVAGHAVELDLIDLQGNMATFERPDGQPFRLPLASLCVTDRARARLEWHQVAIPIGLRPAYNQCRRQLKRLTRLRQAKRLAQDDYVVYRRGFVVHFKAACMRLKLTEENRSRIIMTLSGY